MPNIGAEQWQEWKRSDVTLAVMAQIQDRIDEAKELLIGASNERDFDQYIKGMIRAFTEVLDVRLDFTTEEEEEDEV